jgi:glycerophosphoryl diester phosphodiesterase
VCDQRLIELAHSMGLRVHVWTIDDRPTMERLLDMGVDGIMSDAPAVLREVMQARGLWPAPEEGACPAGPGDVPFGT